MQRFDAIVIGGGAAGLMCAMEAGKRGRSVLVIEHAEKIGKKILISGGGRCNFTNIHCKPENFLSENPHFVKSALAAYTPQDFIALVEKHGIKYHEKTLGQLFCDGSAREVVQMLERECVQHGVRIMVGTRVDGVREIAAESAARFEVATSAGVFQAHSVVIATGGLSIPKMGASGFGYDIARQFGLKIVEPRPALVPLTFGMDENRAFAELSGVSADVITTVPSARVARGRRPIAFREKMLITHRGLSGPAVLQISSYWRPGEPVAIDLVPMKQVTSLLRAPKAKRDQSALRHALYTAMPQRLADRWVALHAAVKHASDLLSTEALDRFEAVTHHWTFVPAGTEGFEKAEVTAGGVSTEELEARTMEAKRVPGLYFIGEVVDVTGHLGGFNFQWAWASGYCAGQGL